LEAQHRLCYHFATTGGIYEPQSVMPKHRYTTAYSLTAYDVETGKELFQWPNIADTERARPSANDTIIAPMDSTG
jgi:hypothetical protein